MPTTYTTNYHLGKQENHAEKFDMNVITENMDKIDNQMKVNSDNVGKNRSALAELVDSGAKNLLKPKSVITTSPTSGGGLTVTRNDDGSITINGTATSAVFIYICTDDENLRAQILGKRLVLSGCPEGGTTGGYRLRCWHYDGALNVGDYGNGVLFTFTNESSTYHFDIAIDNGVVCDNLTFKPMICSKAAWDISHGYVPYRPSYDELIARIEALEGGT